MPRSQREDRRVLCRWAGVWRAHIRYFRYARTDIEPRRGVETRETSSTKDNNTDKAGPP